MPRESWQISREMFLSDEESRLLLDFVRQRSDSATGGDRVTAATDQLIVEILLFSGVRNSEFCRLTVPDVVATESTCALVVHETAARTRLVHIPAWLSVRIADYAHQIRPALLSKSSTDFDRARGPLIINERGRPYERTALYRRVLRILTTAGLGERASVQLLRHTYGYLAYKQTGGNLLFVQRQLGHAHPMVTAIYAQFVNENPNAIADIVGGGFEPTAV